MNYHFWKKNGKDRNRKSVIFGPGKIKQRKISDNSTRYWSLNDLII